MGLIQAGLSAVNSVLADQWKEYFYCEALDTETLVVKGRKKVSSKSTNRGNDNIISNGSVVAVADGQCMIIVDNGKIAELCAEPGEFRYDASSEPSIFAGDLGTSIKETFKVLGKRFTFGGEIPKDQRVYYFNTKEIVGNKYGTPSPVPFRVVDQRAGIDIDIAIRCFGEYSYRVCNPILFYTNVCGNVANAYTRSQLDNQLKTELLTALQPAFAKISEMGIRYSALPAHTGEIADALNDVLSAKWRDLRGIEIVSFGVSSVKANEEDEKLIKEMQRNAAFRDPTMAAAHLVGAQAAAMQGRGDRLHGHEHGPAGRRHERGEPLRNGCPAARAGGPAPRTREGELDLPRLREAGLRQVLHRVRHQEARAGGLDLHELRRGQQGQVLRRVRREEARGGPPLQVRQVRLGAGGSHPSAQVLPRVRRPL